MDRIQNHYDGTSGTVFIQPDGPNKASYPIECLDMADLPEPRGAVTRSWCADPINPGQYVLSLETVAPPGNIETTMTVPIGKTAGYLEAMALKGCRTPFYVKTDKCSPKNVLLNYDRLWVLAYTRLTNHTRTNLVQGMGGSDRSTQAFAMDVRYVREVRPLVQTKRSANLATANWLDIALAGRGVCAGECGPAQAAADVLYVCSSLVGAGVGKVWKSTNHGVTWAACTAQPTPTLAVTAFSSVVAFPLNGSTMRVMVAQGTTNAGAAPEVSYTDDGGVTWANVIVGATVAAFFPYNASLFALDKNHIWAGTNLGEIWFSSNGGLTWATQGVTAVNAVRCIKFVDEAVGVAVGGLTGASSFVWYTLDGGAHWAVAAAPIPAGAAVMANAVIVHDAYRWFVSYENGTIWYTVDGGVTWAQCALLTPSGVTASSANAMARVDDFCFYVALRYTTGATWFGGVQRTFDGGFSWENWTTVGMLAVTHGMQSVVAADYNEAFACGGQQVGLTEPVIVTVA